MVSELGRRVSNHFQFHPAIPHLLWSSLHLIVPYNNPLPIPFLQLLSTINHLLLMTFPPILNHHLLLVDSPSAFLSYAPHLHYKWSLGFLKCPLPLVPSSWMAPMHMEYAEPLLPSQHKHSLDPFFLLCHDRDRTYPYTPYPDLSTPIPSHLNHSWAPNAKPEPSDPLTSQQRTPEHPDSLASSQRIPDPTLIRPFPFLVSSWFLTPTLIPDPMHLQPLLFLASSRFPTTTLIPDPTPFDLHSFASSLFLTFYRSRDCGRAKPDHVPPSLDAS